MTGLALRGEGQPGEEARLGTKAPRASTGWRELPWKPAASPPPAFAPLCPTRLLFGSLCIMRPHARPRKERRKKSRYGCEPRNRILGPTTCRPTDGNRAAPTTTSCAPPTRGNGARLPAIASGPSPSGRPRPESITPLGRGARRPGPLAAPQVEAPGAWASSASGGSRSSRALASAGSSGVPSRSIAGPGSPAGPSPSEPAPPGRLVRGRQERGRVHVLPPPHRAAPPAQWRIPSSARARSRRRRRGPAPRGGAS